METTAKHTPIHAGKDRFGAFLMIGDFRSAMPSIEVATQLAAAPELLEALEELVNRVDTTLHAGYVGINRIVKARDAIRKARGE